MKLKDKITYIEQSDQVENTPYVEYGMDLLDLRSKHEGQISSVFKNKIEVELDNVIYEIKKSKGFMED